MNLTLAALSDSFGRELNYIGRSEATQRTYAEAVRSFCVHVEARTGRTATVADLTKENVRGWLTALRESGATPATRRIRYTGMRQFCKWLVAEDEIAASPFVGLQPPAEAKPVPVPTIDDDHIRALLRVCEGRGFIERRDAALIRVLADTGVRVGELAAMTVDGIDLNAGVLVAAGKTGTRYVYPSRKTTGALDRYLRVRAGHPLASSPKLWLGQRGPLRVEAIRWRLEVRCAEAGIPKINPHRFRHNWTSDFLRHGGEGEEAKRLAGWSSDRMIGVYGAASVDQRAAAKVRALARGDRW